MANSLKSKKFCWLSKQTKKGWRLSFELGAKTYTVPGLFFDSRAAVLKATNSNVVFRTKSEDDEF